MAASYRYRRHKIIDTNPQSLFPYSAVRVEAPYRQLPWIAGVVDEIAVHIAYQLKKLNPPYLGRFHPRGNQVLTHVKLSVPTN